MLPLKFWIDEANGGPNGKVLTKTGSGPALCRASGQSLRNTTASTLRVHLGNLFGPITRGQFAYLPDLWKEWIDCVALIGSAVSAV
jgi:hypothetical protein